MCWPMIWANFDPLRRIPPAQLEIANKGSGNGKLQQFSTHEGHDQRTGRSVTKQLVAESCFLCLTCRHGQWNEPTTRAHDMGHDTHAACIFMMHRSQRSPILLHRYTHLRNASCSQSSRDRAFRSFILKPRCHCTTPGSCRRSWAANLQKAWIPFAWHGWLFGSWLSLPSWHARSCKQCKQWCSMVRHAPEIKRLRIFIFLSVRGRSPVTS